MAEFVSVGSISKERTKFLVESQPREKIYNFHKINELAP